MNVVSHLFQFVEDTNGKSEDKAHGEEWISTVTNSRANRA